MEKGSGWEETAGLGKSHWRGLGAVKGRRRGEWQTGYIIQWAEGRLQWVTGPPIPNEALCYEDYNMLACRPAMLNYQEYFGLATTFKH